MANHFRITIKEIAQEAGVSKQTVSRVLNNRPDVSLKTRKRVQSIIDRNGYQPSKLARGLTRGRTFTLGVVSSDLHHFGPSHTLMGINKEARTRGYTLSLSLVDNLEKICPKTILGNLLSQHVDGVIWAAVTKDGEVYEQIVAQLAKLPIPVVATTQPGYPIYTVHVDNCAGAKLAVAHLAKRGYETIGFIAGPSNEWSAQQRKTGWKQSLAALGKTADSTLIATGDWTAVSGANAFRQLIYQRPDIDAVFVSNDHMALGALKAAQEMGLCVPQDLGIVGFDDTPEAGYFTPALTTVRQDLRQIGRLLVAELDQQIQAPHKRESNGHPKQTVIQPQLIIRTSSMRQQVELAQV
ncbi:MAG: LacI family DNA-binding transcriptional regulator [Chloroflexota bacterium]